MAYTPNPSEVPLSQPLYGATMGQAINRFWKKYVVFSGRASRSEYWWWILVAYIVGIVLQAIARSVGDSSAAGDVVNGITGLWGLATLLPSLGLLWRRLHDSNHSGFNVFWIFLPLVGWVILLVFVIQASRPEGQRFDV